MNRIISFEDINKICKISINAGKICLKHYKKQNKISYKNDKSPLTKADIDSNQYITKSLNKNFQKFNILSEENKIIEFNKRKKWKKYWLIDPLDGTKEFIKKNGEFTVNIALMVNNNPIFGVIYIPVLDQIYYAFKGKGSYFHNNASSNLKKNLFSIKNKIKCRSLINKISVICSRSHKSDDLLTWLKYLSNYKKINYGSSIKFCKVAHGVADVYPRFVGSSEWDIAAAHIIVKEAGGNIRTIKNKKISYNKKSLRNEYFICYSNEFKKKFGLNI